MNPNDCESKLRELGKDWKNDPVFVDRVLEEINEDASLRITSKGMKMLKLNLIGLAAAVIVIAVFFFLPDTAPVSAKSLSAAIREAIAEVNTVHIVTYGPDKKTGELKAGADTWFVRGKGYARITKVFFEIDDGQYYWEYRPEINDSIVFRQKSLNIGAMFEETTFPESEYERLPDEDKVISGVRLSCYSRKNLAPFQEGPRRCYYYVTPEQRISKSVTWMFKDGKWDLLNEQRFHYNVEVDEEVFKPKLAKNQKVVDLDAEFDQLTSLENSLFRKTVGGFDYAVHRVRALKRGGVMMFVSVRPSESQPPGFSADVYDVSSQIGDEFRIKLGNTHHNGIGAQWFIRVPRDKGVKWDHIKDGRLKLQESICPYDKSYNSIFQEVELDVAVENWNEPISLEQAAKEVYESQKTLPNISVLDMGVFMDGETPTRRTGDVSTVTADEYADFVVEHLGYWRGLDTANERNEIERAIKYGTVNIRVPGIAVGGLSTFNDDDLARAVVRKGLVAIYLNETSVTDAGLKSLSGQERLETLYLDSTRVSDTGLESVSSISTLKTLDVRGTNVTKAGIEKLQKAIPGLEIESDFE